MAFRFVSCCDLPTDAGMFEMRVYKHSVTGQDAIAMVARLRHGGVLRGAGAGSLSPAGPVPDDAVLLRVQDQCMTSEIFGSIKCDCKQQLDYSLALLHSESCRKYDAAHSSSAATSATSNSATQTGSYGIEGANGVDQAVSHQITSVSTSGQQHLSADSAVARTDAALGPGGVASSVSSRTATGSAGGSSPQSVSGDSDSEADKVSTLSTAEHRSGAEAEVVDEDSVVGLVVYLLQEGRGIGLAAKIAAYALQEAVEGDGDGDNDSDAEAEAEEVGASSGAGAQPQHTHSHSHSHGHGHVHVHAHADDNLSAGSSSPALLSPSVSSVTLSSSGSNSSSSSSSSSSNLRRDGRSGRGRGRGLDTVDANRALGLPDDTREYSAVKDILTDLHLMSASASGGSSSSSGSSSGGKLQLLSNNPRKSSLLKELGVPLAGRLPCAVPVTSPYAAAYLRTKVERMGHDIPAHVFSFPVAATAPLLATTKAHKGAVTAAAAPSAGLRLAL